MRNKFTAMGGPDGGDGGRGGHIILKGNRNLWTLLHLRYHKNVLAENGEETFMMFFDLGKDSSASFEWASRFEDAETRDAFLIAFRQIADRYEDVENLVQLELSTAFPSNPAVF